MTVSQPARGVGSAMNFKGVQQRLARSSAGSGGSIGHLHEAILHAIAFSALAGPRRLEAKKPIDHTNKTGVFLKATDEKQYEN